MKALVTGASGFLGRHLCNKLLQLGGHHVVALERDSTIGLNWGATTTVRGGFEQVERAIAEYEIDTVFHLAAQTQVSTAVADPTGTFETNVRGTQTVLEACRRQKVRRIIIASSDKAYGDGPVPYREDQPLRPHGVYATSKAMADMLAQSYALEYGMPIAITRCGNLYGPGHLNWSTLIPSTIRSALKGENIKLRSDGGPQRDFLFIEDAVDGYLKLAASNFVGPMNFGTGAGVSVRQIVDEIIRQIDPALDTVHVLNKSAVEIYDQYLDTSLANDRLSWAPKHTDVEGLKKTIDWYRNYLGGAL